MDLAELRIFRAVVNEGGVTRAAERVCCGRPADRPFRGDVDSLRAGIL